MKIILFFFWKAIKIAGSAQKNGVVRVSGNTCIFLGLKAFDYFRGGPKRFL